MVAIAAALVGSVSPQAVQVSVSGLSSGDGYEVVGVWSGGTWPVRGGVGVSTGSLLVLNDLSAPINTPVTYRVTSGVDVVDSAPVTVGMRSVAFYIPGRPDPIVITDRPTAESGDLVARTDRDGSTVMRSLLELGGLALLRTDGSVRDLPATTYLLVKGASSALTGHQDDRDWSLSYRLTSDPEPGSVAVVSTWDDVDAAYAGLTWADVDAEWAGQSWDDFDTYDWSSRA